MSRFISRLLDYLYDRCAKHVVLGHYIFTRQPVASHRLGSHQFSGHNLAFMLFLEGGSASLLTV